MSSKIALLIDLSALPYWAVLDETSNTLLEKICPGQRGDSVLDLLAAGLQEIGLCYADFTLACVGTGPGSFTGVRVGIAAVEGLCFAKQLPIYPFSTLQSMLICAESSTLAVIPGNAGHFFVAAQDLSEQVFTELELKHVSNKYVTILTSGEWTGKAELVKSFAQQREFSQQVNFSAIAKMAMQKDPILKGIIKPNYAMASAAEQKRNLSLL